MKATTDRPQTVCRDCGADKMGCDIKLGLSGRRCCENCTHQPSTSR